MGCVAGRTAIVRTSSALPSTAASTPWGHRPTVATLVVFVSPERYPVFPTRIAVMLFQQLTNRSHRRLRHLRVHRPTSTRAWSPTIRLTAMRRMKVAMGMMAQYMGPDSRPIEMVLPTRPIIFLKSPRLKHQNPKASLTSILLLVG